MRTITLNTESAVNLSNAPTMTNAIDTSRLLKDLLRLNHTSYAQIARQLGVSRTAVSLVASGRSNSERVRQAIAEASGLTVAQIWQDDAARRNFRTNNKKGNSNNSFKELNFL